MLLLQTIVGHRTPYLIHTANIFALLAMGSQDMLSLRTFMICGNFFGIAYNLVQPRPLVASALWGALFTVGHAFQVYLLLKKDDFSLSHEELDFYEEAFLKAGFTPREFKTILEEADAKWVQ